MNRNHPYSPGTRGYGVGLKPSDKLNVSRESLGLNVGVLFLRDKNIEGVRLLQDLGIVKQLQIHFGNCNGGHHNSFPANMPEPLNKRHFQTSKETGSYVVAPKPLGVRYLLCVDPEGKMFMMNESKHIFIVDQDHTPQMIPKDTALDGVITSKIVRDGAAQHSSTEENLTFVIMDATRVNGIWLKDSTFEERIAIAKAEIVQPHLDSINKKSIFTKRDVFDLDIAKYEALSHMNEYLTPGFKDLYEYPIGSFLFKPFTDKYRLGKSGQRVLEWDESRSEEFTFRLKILFEIGHEYGYLYAIGTKPKGIEVKAGTIDLTDELREMNESIIECRNVGNRWLLVGVRNDCEHPNVHVWLSGKIKAPVSSEFLLDALQKTV